MLVWTEKSFTGQMSATSRVKTVDDPAAPEELASSLDPEIQISKQRVLREVTITR
jgi:hypothetical protein